jgi:hypothetical protein
MSISSRHPVNAEFETEFPLIRDRVLSFEKKIEAGEDKYELLLGLKDLRDRIYDLQVQEFGSYLDKNKLPEDLSMQEEEIIAKLIDLENRIDSMMREV